MVFTLLKGDCLEKMKSIADKSVDLIIADLPFGCLIGGGGEEKKRRQLIRYVDGKETHNTAVYNGGVIAGCPWDIKIDLDQFWKQIKRIRKNDHTPCLMFTTTKYGYELIKSNEKEFRYDLVWDKQRGVSFLTANKMPMRSHEMIYVFSKAGANYYRKDIEGDFKEWKHNLNGNIIKSNTYKSPDGGYDIIQTTQSGGKGVRCPLSVIQINGSVGKGKHPTEKPIDLYKFLIERYSKEGDTVCDPTFGSCNSGVASVELKRRYIGIEKDENFFNKGVNKMI